MDGKRFLFRVETNCKSHMERVSIGILPEANLTTSLKNGNLSVSLQTKTSREPRYTSITFPCNRISALDF